MSEVIIYESDSGKVWLDADGRLWAVDRTDATEWVSQDATEWVSK